MRRFMLSWFIIVVFLTGVYGTENAFLVTNIGTSARMLGLGQIRGFDNTAVSVFENPASLSNIDIFSVSAFTTNLFDEVDYRNISMALKTWVGVFAVGYMDAGVTGIPYTEPNIFGSNTYFEVLDTYDVMLRLYKIGYQFPLYSEFQMGLAYNLYHNSIYDVTAKGSNFDVGLYYKREYLRLSFYVQNINNNLKLNYSNGTYETYPLQSDLGVSYLFDEFEVLGQLSYQENGGFLISLGSAYSPKFLSFVELLAGYKQQRYLDVMSHHFNLGLGVNLMGLKLYYSYEKSDHVAFDHYNYFSIAWGN